jgi:NAD(P)H-dependent FMN reductase
MTIAIISASVREGRKSHRVALFFKHYLTTVYKCKVELVDLKEYNFPVFEERLRLQKNPSETVKEFASIITNADGVLIVTPEYNGGYPASLKNCIDLLYDEWHRKPVCISTVSDGVFGGAQVITSLQFSLWKIRAWVVPAMFPVPKVNETFREDGTPVDENIHKRAKIFLDELLWCITANEKMKDM